ncbi:SOS response-associated peptidase [Lutibacter citreus]|uniref:SOS response-associated peptidase n=1 Tax=Lutibacter citreus TaxID=2138210 RepID=UPI000DBE7593|nr:SOS response-associated peptidase [Lutibacter citreus]
MCYQTRLIKKREEIAERFNTEIDALNDYEPIEFCKAFNYPKTPVITKENPSEIKFFNWGLIPQWSKSEEIKQYTLNARIETLSEKASFKNVVKNRCLIIADGFYEWQWKNKSGYKKEKYLITLPNEKLFAFAGIYSQWVDFKGNTTNTYSIVTTQANELMSTIHNTKKRMPVILKEEDELNWLNGTDYKDFAYPYTCKLIAKSTEKDNGQFGLF